MKVYEDGVCRCHGLLSPVRTPAGDIARVTNERECILQRIGIWLATKKGERPLHPAFGCCIKEYINKPMTLATLKALQGAIKSDLDDLFPEYPVKNLRVTVPERNTVRIQAYVGHVEVDFLGSEPEINKLHDQLNHAMSDLGMAAY
jgi:phage baseplate assembly protein W